MNTIWTIKFNPFNFYFKEDLETMEITDKISMFDIYAKFAFCATVLLFCCDIELFLHKSNDRKGVKTHEHW